MGKKPGRGGGVGVVGVNYNGTYEHGNLLLFIFKMKGIFLCEIGWVKVDFPGCESTLNFIRTGVWVKSGRIHPFHAGIIRRGKCDHPSLVFANQHFGSIYSPCPETFSKNRKKKKRKGESLKGSNV